MTILAIALTVILSIAPVSVAVAANESAHCGPKSGKECPEPSVVYLPNLPRAGQYSMPGVCQAIHGDDAAKVILRNGEKLQNALKRLKKSTGSEGGVIEVPWDVDTVQCDRLRVVRNQTVRTLTIRGILGPDGEMPRFYCRAAKLGGTIQSGWGATFLELGSGDLNHPPQYLVENLHVDGYGTWFMSPRAGKAVYRSNYVHHATNDGNNVNGISWSSDPRLGVDIEYCGNELSHGGQGNAKHTFYLHRGIPGSEISVRLVDNICHSSNWSSCYKSTANVNYLHNNRFYKTVPPDEYPPHNSKYALDTDPAYKRSYSQMMVDISACADNVIEGNYFYHWRPQPKGYAGNWMLAFRNRRGIHGCNIPRGYVGTNTTAKPLPDSEFWDPEYWASISGTYPIKSVVKGNIFESRGPDAKATAVYSMGTYPSYASRQFGPACLLEAPSQWYERHRVYVSGNTYIGFENNGELYRSNAPGHFVEKCGPLPATANLREDDMIIVGEGEKRIDIHGEAQSQ